MHENSSGIPFEVVSNANIQRLQDRTYHRYVQSIQSLMGQKLTADTTQFRDKYVKSSTRGFDYGAAFIFLPIYLQTQKEDLDISWHLTDTNRFIREWALSTSFDMGVTSQRWMGEKLKSLGKDMLAYIWTEEKKMRQQGKRRHQGFLDGVTYMSHIAVAELEIARLKKLWPPRG